MKERRNVIPGVRLPEFVMDTKSDKKIRVLYVITRLTIGGDTNVLLDMASYFKEHPDFEAELAVGPVPDSEVDLTYLADERNISPTLIPGLVNFIKPWLNLKAILVLQRLMRKEKYDIVHTHSSVGGVLGRLAAIIARVPVIIHHVHGWGVNDYMPKLTRIVYLNFERFLATYTHRLIAVSNPTIQKGLNYGIGTENKFALIYNGIPLGDFRRPFDRMEVLLGLGLDPERKSVGMIGRLDQQKNPLDFIRAAAWVVKEYPKVQFLIAGEGSMRSACERLIDELDLKDIFFLLGFRNDINKVLSVLDLTVLSSLWEGLPIVFQESMSAGIPIVANDIDGARDVVIHGETGYLVKPHQPEEMAVYILRLLKDDVLCQKMGRLGQKYSDRFSTERMVIEIEGLYRELYGETYKKSRIGVRFSNLFKFMRIRN